MPVIEAQFFSDLNFKAFLEDVEAQFGRVPGQVDERRLSLLVSATEYIRNETEWRELVQEYGGRVLHKKT